MTDIKEYCPDRAVKQGYVSLAREMVSELVSSRWLTWQFFKRTFVATYRQSILGVFWAFIVPFVSVGTLIFLNKGGVFDVGTMSVPYPLFALAGVAIWQIFSIGVTLGTNSLVSAGPMVARIYFTRESLVVASAAQGFIPALVQTGVVFILFGYYQIHPPLTVLLVPLAIIPLVMITLGLAFILSLLNGVARDIGNGIGVLVTFLMFATPILYARPSSGIVAAISRYNPLYYLVAVPRDLLIIGTTNEMEGYLYATLFSLVVFVLCWMAFHLAESRIAEKI